MEMGLAIWAILALMVSLTAGAAGFSRRLAPGPARVAEVVFGVFLAMFVALTAAEAVTRMLGK